MKKIVLSLVALMALSSLGYAEEINTEEKEETREPMDQGVYIGLSYTHLSHDVDGRGGRTAAEMDFNAASLQVGYKFNPYISVEGRYAISFGDPTWNEAAVVKDADITIWGIYAKPTYPLGPEFDVYALLGYAGTEATGYFDVAGTPSSFSVDEGAFSWGIGGRYIVTENISVYADYVVYYDDSSLLYDKVIDGMNFGISYQF
ncbi:MAG: porin family protein [Campylobacterota bacterium]|nr:porin family protein [Campylobacterota bacterium]